MRSFFTLGFVCLTLACLAQTGGPRQADSLQARRGLLTTRLYANGQLLTNRTVREAFRSYPKALTPYHWGRGLRPVGPLLALGGLAVGYKGIRGEAASALVRGTKTPSDPYPADVRVDYRVRSLPTVLGGLGMLISGLVLIEISNGLTARAATTFNAGVRASGRSHFHLEQVYLGPSPSGGVGLVATF